MPKIKRPRGGQPGNKNARTHGFYSRVLDEAEQRDLLDAAEIEGIDDEIALLRVKIAALIEHDPNNLELLVVAANTLARMVKTRYGLNHKDGKGIKDAIAGVLRDIALPMGIGYTAGKMGP